MTYTPIEKFGRRLRQDRKRRRAIQNRYYRMLASRLEREGPGIVDPVGAAIFRDTQRAINRFNKTNKDGHYD